MDVDPPAEQTSSFVLQYSRTKAGRDMLNSVGDDMISGNHGHASVHGYTDEDLATYMNGRNGRNPNAILGDALWKAFKEAYIAAGRGPAVPGNEYAALLGLLHHVVKVKLVKHRASETGAGAHRSSKRAKTGNGPTAPTVPTGPIS